MRAMSKMAIGVKSEKNQVISSPMFCNGSEYKNKHGNKKGFKIKLIEALPMKNPSQNRESSGTNSSVKTGGQQTVSKIKDAPINERPKDNDKLMVFKKTMNKDHSLRFMSAGSTMGQCNEIKNSETRLKDGQRPVEDNVSGNPEQKMYSHNIREQNTCRDVPKKDLGNPFPASRSVNKCAGNYAKVSQSRNSDKKDRQCAKSKPGSKKKRTSHCRPSKEAPQKHHSNRRDGKLSGRNSEKQGMKRVNPKNDSRCHKETIQRDKRRGRNDSKSRSRNRDCNHKEVRALDKEERRNSKGSKTSLEQKHSKGSGAVDKAKPKNKSKSKCNHSKELKANKRRKHDNSSNTNKETHSRKPETVHKEERKVHEAPNSNLYHKDRLSTESFSKVIEVCDRILQSKNSTKKIDNLQERQTTFGEESGGKDGESSFVDQITVKDMSSSCETVDVLRIKDDLLERLQSYRVKLADGSINITIAEEQSGAFEKLMPYVGEDSAVRRLFNITASQNEMDSSEKSEPTNSGVNKISTRTSMIPEEYAIEQDICSASGGYSISNPKNEMDVSHSKQFALCNRSANQKTSASEISTAKIKREDNLDGHTCIESDATNSKTMDENDSHADRDTKSEEDKAKDTYLVEDLKNQMGHLPSPKLRLPTIPLHKRIATSSFTKLNRSCVLGKRSALDSVGEREDGSSNITSDSICEEHDGATVEFNRKPGDFSPPCENDCNSNGRMFGPPIDHHNPIVSPKTDDDDIYVVTLHDSQPESGSQQFQRVETHDEYVGDCNRQTPGVVLIDSSRPDVKYICDTLSDVGNDEEPGALSHNAQSTSKYEQTEELCDGISGQMELMKERINKLGRFKQNKKSSSSSTDDTSMISDVRMAVPRSAPEQVIPKQTHAERMAEEVDSPAPNLLQLTQKDANYLEDFGIYFEKDDSETDDKPSAVLGYDSVQAHVLPTPSQEVDTNTVIQDMIEDNLDYPSYSRDIRISDEPRFPEHIKGDMALVQPRLDNLTTTSVDSSLVSTMIHRREEKQAPAGLKCNQHIDGTKPVKLPQKSHLSAQYIMDDRSGSTQASAGSRSKSCSTRGLPNTFDTPIVSDCQVVQSSSPVQVSVSGKGTNRLSHDLNGGQFMRLEDSAANGPPDKYQYSADVHGRLPNPSQMSVTGQGTKRIVQPLVTVFNHSTHNYPDEASVSPNLERQYPIVSLSQLAQSTCKQLPVQTQGNIQVAHNQSGLENQPASSYSNNMPVAAFPGHTVRHYPNNGFVPARNTNRVDFMKTLPMNSEKLSSHNSNANNHSSASHDQVSHSISNPMTVPKQKLAQITQEPSGIPTHVYQALTAQYVHQKQHEPYQFINRNCMCPFKNHRTIDKPENDMHPIELPAIEKRCPKFARFMTTGYGMRFMAILMNIEETIRGCIFTEFCRTRVCPSVVYQEFCKSQIHKVVMFIDILEKEFQLHIDVHFNNMNSLIRRLNTHAVLYASCRNNDCRLLQHIIRNDFKRVV